MMRTKGILAILILGMLLICVLACGDPGPPKATPKQTPTPTPALTKCERDRDAIQEALDDYHAEKGEWPTADGQPGDIEWDKLVPDFLARTPSTDVKCDWQVNSNPEGEICLLETC